MKTQSRWLCCVAVWLIAHALCAADTASGQPRKAAAGKPKATIRAAGVTGGTKTSQSKPAKGEAKTKTASSDHAPRRKGASLGLEEQLSFDNLGFRFFPLALLIHGGRAVESFLAADPRPLPAELIRAQVSRRLLENRLQLAIASQDVIDDSLLGAKIDGLSDLSGTIQLVLKLSSRDIRFDLVFQGVSQAHTQGIHSVVAVQNSIETHLLAEKSFILNAI